MEFKMVCPKCQTYDYSIERDRRLYSLGAPSSDFIYSCRCGKRLFGDQVGQEFERQRKEWESSAQTREAKESEREQREREEREREDALQRAFAYRAKYLADKKKKERANAAREKEEDYMRWQQRLAGETVGSEPTEVAAPDSDETCEWDPCNNARRNNSKYCSRACSNKNARQRHKRRKTTKKGGKAAA